MFNIKSLHAREILDSRGFPTVEAELCLNSGAKALASVPSGASTGTYEALELRDQDSTRYMGKGVQAAVNNVCKVIAPSVIGKSFADQAALDHFLLSQDGTANKSKLGANAILAVSLAFAKACALEKQVPLYQHLSEISSNKLSMPVPMMNILNGGAHADNNVDVQEFMIMPVGAENWNQALQMGVEIYHALKHVLREGKLMTGVGDEGGFAPNLSSNQEALDKIMSAIERAGLVAGKDVFLALDVAANELFNDNKYYLASDNKQLSATQLIDMYESWVQTYPILSIEDALQESDFSGWQEITERLGSKIQLVGDDVFVTNPTRLKQGIEKQIANAILIKLNQIGTLTETLETIALAKNAHYQTIISHRSGETEESFIADLSVGVGAMQIKTGAPARTDRIVKYNQLTRIYEQSKAVYAGKHSFTKWLHK
ncbi:phosphopyruvate hydratase [Candidatus Berkiella cookevillensis]|uniref:Enolase n=1 Tax=Candidatus Berkiella cookevillensis TaxID=437022 RepID=A0A0Q9YJW6_9GAMM|nr:phosphopyruvate hydratase [Candidatus Berkiella cookevillensis]MCS5708382.1 phosphopyruvate hydratase [Candidatus Berkiella cookevillensis]